VKTAPTILTGREPKSNHLGGKKKTPANGKKKKKKKFPTKKCRRRGNGEMQGGKSDIDQKIGWENWGGWEKKKNPKKTQGPGGEKKGRTFKKKDNKTKIGTAKKNGTSFKGKRQRGGDKGRESALREYRDAPHKVG